MTLHHTNCGGLVLPGSPYFWKAWRLKQDGTEGCCLCGKQPLSDDEIYSETYEFNRYKNRKDETGIERYFREHPEAQ